MAGKHPLSGEVLSSGGVRLSQTERADLAADCADSFLGVPVAPDRRACVMLAVLPTGRDSWTAQLVAARLPPRVSGHPCSRQDAANNNKSFGYVAPDAFVGSWGPGGVLASDLLRGEGAVASSAVSAAPVALLVARVRMDVSATWWTVEEPAKKYDEREHGAWDDPCRWRLAWDADVFRARVAGAPGLAGGAKGGIARCADGFRRRVPKMGAAVDKGVAVLREWRLALAADGARWWVNDEARGGSGVRTTWTVTDNPDFPRNSGRMLVVARTYDDDSVGDGNGTVSIGDGVAAPKSTATAADGDDASVYEVEVGILNSARGCPRAEVQCCCAPGSVVAQDLFAAFVDVATARLSTALARSASAWCAANPADIAASKLAAARSRRPGKRPAPSPPPALARALEGGKRSKKAP